MARAAQLMGEELSEVTGEEAYASCGLEVSASLEQLDAEVRDILSAVPEERRVLVSDHDSFGYFADVYGFDVLGVVIPGGSTDAEPSSRELAALVETITEAGVPAIFSNTAVDSPLMQAVATEVGTDVEVVDLYVGSVGPDGSGAETYRDMMLTNARLVADALD
jgi:zinc/manganese transport system substrate-binding protein